MARRTDVVLEEILDAIAGIESAIADKGLKALDSDWLLQRGVERGIEIISEAVRHIPDELLAKRPDMPWPEIKAIGNRIRHEYHRISPSIVRSVVVDDIPVLKTAISGLLDALRGQN
jgi:uncharacterized protein with HEPN domain